MNTAKKWLTAALIVVVTLMLTGAPALAQAQTSAATPAGTTAQQDSSTATAGQDASPVTAPQENNGVVDPSKGPLQPVPSTEPPNAPSSTNTQNPPPQPGNVPPPAEAPAGAGVGQRGVTAGGAAAKPAGNAIAPAKQRQTRSLLIKLGLLGAAGVAIGTVVGLSKSSPSKPPGAR